MDVDGAPGVPVVVAWGEDETLRISWVGADEGGAEDVVRGWDCDLELPVGRWVVVRVRCTGRQIGVSADGRDAVAVPRKSFDEDVVVTPRESPGGPGCGLPTREDDVVCPGPRRSGVQATGGARGFFDEVLGGRFGRVALVS